MQRSRGCQGTVREDGMTNPGAPRLAMLRDLLSRRRNQVLERVGLNRGWLRELSAYYRGMTIQEFWVRYTLGRMDAATLWERKPRTTESDYRSFYAETDYFVLRQMYYHRNDCYHSIARLLRRAGRAGDFCEYGCGVGPVTAWLHRRFPGWRYTLVDLPSPMLEFARWRFRSAGNVEFREPGLGSDLPLRRAYDLITCLDVLEHVINPLEVVRHFVAHLKPGASLVLNFVQDAGGENLVESAAQRTATIQYLNSTLRPIVPLALEGTSDVDAHYVKPTA
jgi:2-polyprenyl-3-methyl-5-hydroxy-6-metoxy-1,4-benzoquinol methylase